MANKFVSSLFKTGQAFEQFLTTLDNFRKNVISGATSVGKAKQATKATQDAKGNDIEETYAKIVDLTNGTRVVQQAGSAQSALKATQDGDGKVISTTYAKNTDLTSGKITVKNATNAGSATSATIVKAEAKTVHLVWGAKVSESASADVELDSNSAYLFTLAIKDNDFSMSFVLYTLENKLVTSLCSYGNFHYMLFYNDTTKELYFQRYCFIESGSYRVGLQPYAQGSGNDFVVTYAKIANLT